MRLIALLLCAFSMALIQAQESDTRSQLLAMPLTPELGGQLTVERSDREAFKQMAPNAGGMSFPQFIFGQQQFLLEWDPAPGQVPDTDGLGPTFNAVACASCHINNGRGQPPLEAGEFESILVRLSVAGNDNHGGPAPLQNYGGQLQHRAVDGVPAEGKATIKWHKVSGQFADGTSYELRAPELEFSGLAFGRFPQGVMHSLRVANPVVGLGLLSAVPAATLESLADPDDNDGDGISGRLNRVWDPEIQATVPGRFGWKANVATLTAQSAGAALGDMGITTELHPADNCPSAQERCNEVAAEHVGEPQFRTAFFEQLVHYMNLLAVPRQRDESRDAVRQGEALFFASGCVQCHMPTLQTGEQVPLPALGQQTFHPFTDLLLHDMGEGLADNRPDYLAGGREWRTPPLWGLGLSETVTGHSTLLHDGRARSIPEAILWHGGEAAAAQSRFVNMPVDQREALISFLQSL